MRFLLEPLLPPEQVQALVEPLQTAEAPWRPGAETAGWHARTVKRNHQLDRASALHQELEVRVREALLAHPLVRSAALPPGCTGCCSAAPAPGRATAATWTTPSWRGAAPIFPSPWP